MSNFVTIREDIGGDTREVAINLNSVQEIRNDGDVLMFAFADGISTVAILDEALQAGLAAHGVVFSENAEVAKAA